MIGVTAEVIDIVTLTPLELLLVDVTTADLELTDVKFDLDAEGREGRGDVFCFLVEDDKEPDAPGVLRGLPGLVGGTSADAEIGSSV
jgi:hypothetical protein